MGALALTLFIPLPTEAGAPRAEAVIEAENAPPPPHGQTMTYDVYAGGIHAVKARLNVGYGSADRYSLKLDAWTTGFLAKLVPWSGSFETTGWKKKDGAEHPEIHRSKAVWRGEEELKEYFYGKDGTFEKLHVVEEGKDQSPDKIDPVLVDGTIDALTATLYVMRDVAAGEKCESSSQVFDGKRRFEMTFRHHQDEALNATNYNIFEGDTARCEVEVKPVAGDWHKKPRGWMSIQEQGRIRDSLPTVWMAKIDENSPAVPVKIRVKTDYGVLFMHLTEYAKDGKIIKTSTR